MFLGLRTVIYPAADLGAATAWFRDLLGAPPSFEAPTYVGFDVGGFELGLVPATAATAATAAYWGVADCEVAVGRLLAAGATLVEPIEDVGDGIRLAMMRAPDGAAIGVIENPVFAARPVPDDVGPGR